MLYINKVINFINSLSYLERNFCLKKQFKKIFLLAIYIALIQLIKKFYFTIWCCLAEPESKLLALN